MIGDFSLAEWQIRLVLPHRPPLLQLDRVERCPAALDALDASKALGGSDAMLLRRPGVAAQLAPGAVIEALAQCCGLLLRLRWLAAAGADLIAFADGDSTQLDTHDIPRSVLAESTARFTAPAKPGDTLRLGVRLVLSRGGMHRFNASARHAAEVASVQIMLQFPYSA